MKLSKEYWEKECVIKYSRNQWPLKRAVLWQMPQVKMKHRRKEHNRGKDI